MNGIGKTARNERKKLMATTFNAVGLAFTAIGVIQPVVTGNFGAAALAKLLLCAVVTYILNRHAMRLLASLED